jgi:hypothetical protein
MQKKFKSLLTVATLVAINENKVWRGMAVSAFGGSLESGVRR